MRLIRLAIILAISATTLAGCKSMFSMDRNKPLTPYQHCLELKRRVIFYSNDPNHNTDWSTPAKRAAILQEYRENDCAELLRNTSHHFWE